jgi:hypothetical protein
MEFYQFFTYTAGVDEKGKLDEWEKEWEDEVIFRELVFPLAAGPHLKFGSLNWKAIKLGRPRLRLSPSIGVPILYACASGTRMKTRKAMLFVRRGAEIQDACK